MRSIRLAALSLLLACAANAFAGDYGKDMTQPVEAVAKATWTSKAQEELYYKVLNEYERDRNDALVGLLKLIASTEKDVSSGWTSTRGLGAVALARVKDQITRLDQLGLNEWAAREKLMWEKLAGEQFLQSRKNLMSMREASLAAAKVLDEKWKTFEDENKSTNEALVERSSKLKDRLTGWAKVTGEFADGLGQAVGNYPALAAILQAMSFAKYAEEARPVLESLNQKMQSKKGNWEYLNKLNEFQQQMWEQVQPDKVNRAFADAKFDEVSGSEDYKKFVAAADDALKVHRDAALAADDEYRKMVTGRFADRSSSTVENILKVDWLTKEFNEIEALESKVEKDLKRIDAEREKMRDGPEKAQVTEALKKARKASRASKTNKKETSKPTKAKPAK